MKKILTVLAFLFFLLLPAVREVKAVVPIGNYLELIGGYMKAETGYSYAPAGFAFEAWIRPESTSGVQNIISIGDKTSRNLHYEAGINGGSFSVNYRYGRGSQKVITVGYIEPNIWNHIAFSISSSHTKLFINGSEVFSTSGAGSLLPVGKSIVIGSSYLESVSGGIFRGEIDEIRISDAPRDVAGLWGAGVYDLGLTSDSNTLALWRLDGARGEVQVLDSSGKGNDATLFGGDSKIHFYGVLPTPTPRSMTVPTLRWSRPVLPTLSILLPARRPTPTQADPRPVDPTVTPLTSDRYYRPIYPR